MAKHNVGAKNGMWKGGRVVASNGYVLVRVGVGHHLADVRGYAYEHRLVAEQKLGRQMKVGEVVHHKNEIKTDNRPENIEVVESIAHHSVEHRKHDRGRRLPGQPSPVVSCACGCGATFSKFDSNNRPRSYVSGHNVGARREC